MENAGQLTGAANGARNIPVFRRVDLAWWLSLIALSALMFVQLWQTSAVIVFMAAVMAYGIIRPYEVFNAVIDSNLMWPFLLYAALSVVWSQEPGLTARGATQLVFTAVAAALLVRALTTRGFIAAIMVSCLVATCASIIYLGPSLFSQLESGFPVQGIFSGSKNTFGAVEALLILAGFYFVVDPTRSLMMRLLMFACIILAAVLLIGSRSATAVGALGPALICSGAAYFLVKFSLRWRAIIVVAVLTIGVLSTPLAIPLMESGYSLFLDTTGKDVTLTGRTLLWQWADKLIAERPILGFGYEAFWVPSNPYVYAIWREQGLDWRPGLHFHNQWYEITIELGYVGLAFTLIPFLIALFEVARWAIRAPSPESCFFFAFLVYTTIHMYVELDLFAQYDLAFIIFIASYLYARRDKKRRTSRIKERPAIGRSSALSGT